MQDGVSGSSETGSEGAAPFPQFSATLLPHRSMSRKGFVAPMLATASLSLGAGAAFSMRGAGPAARARHSAMHFRGM
jgi:uncharacterized membrane protein